MKSGVIPSLENGLNTTDVLSDIYPGCGDRTFRVVGRKMQIFFSHLDSERVAVLCLVVQSLWIPERGE